MFAQKPTKSRGNGWYGSAKRILYFTLSVVSVNAVTVLAARTCASVRELGRENRESRKWYELYRDVMASQDSQQQPWAESERDRVSGLPMAELKEVIKWSERRQPLTEKN